MLFLHICCLESTEAGKTGGVFLWKEELAPKEEFQKRSSLWKTGWRKDSEVVADPEDEVDAWSWMGQKMPQDPGRWWPRWVTVSNVQGQTSQVFIPHTYSLLDPSPSLLSSFRCSLKVLYFILWCAKLHTGLVKPHQHREVYHSKV